MKRSRLKYFIYIIIVIITGLISRKFSNVLPSFIGDGLWALMVFLIFGFIFNRASILKNFIYAIIFSYIIEISQLYHAPWIDGIRATTLGGLVLGYVFSWLDIGSYTVGITAGAAFEKILKK